MAAGDGDDAPDALELGFGVGWGLRSGEARGAHPVDVGEVEGHAEGQTHQSGAPEREVPGGESEGRGGIKSTLGRCIARLYKPTAGEITLILPAVARGLAS